MALFYDAFHLTERRPHRRKPTDRRRVSPGAEVKVKGLFTPGGCGAAVKFPGFNRTCPPDHLGETFINSSNFSFNPDLHRNGRDMGDKILIYLLLVVEFYALFEQLRTTAAGLHAFAADRRRRLPRKSGDRRRFYFTIYLKCAITYVQ